MFDEFIVSLWRQAEPGTKRLANKNKLNKLVEGTGSNAIIVI